MERRLNPITLAISHPILAPGRHLLVPDGLTLAESLALHGVTDPDWFVTVGEQYVPPAMWSRVRVHAGGHITARAIGRKQVLQLAAVAALSYFTLGAGGIAGGSFLGLTGGLGYAAAGAAFIAGSFVVNALLGPKVANVNGASASETVAPTYALSGIQNAARPFERLVIVLGCTRMVPDLASKQYGEFNGEDQILYAIFHGGINAGQVYDLQIAGTAVSNYEGVTLDFAGFQQMPQSVMPNVVADTVPGALLESPSGPIGPYAIRTSSLDTVLLAVDMEFNLFSTDLSTGKTTNLDLDVSMEYAPSGTNAWVPFVDTGTLVRVTSASQKPVRLTYSRNVPAGRYDVRIAKATLDNTTSGSSNVTSWVSLKSYQLDTADYAGQARARVSIKATGQLNGSLDSLSWTALAAPLPLWTGSAWVTGTSPDSNGVSNPGAIALMLMRGIYRPSDGRLIAGLGFPDSMLDMDSWKAFMVRCIQRDFRFDAVIQTDTSRGSLLSTVLDAGYARLTRSNGKYGVSWLAENQPIEGVINMTSIRARSFSVDYNLTPGADEISYEVFDRDNGWTWQSVRVTAPNIAGTPQNTTSVATLGITRQPYAAERARLTMAQNVYGRKTFSFDMDLEHMVYRVGSVVSLSHDLTQYGYGGRLTGVNVTGASSFDALLDSPVPLTSGPIRTFGVQLPGETQLRLFPVTGISSDGRAVAVSGAWPGISFGTVQATRWAYDFKATPGQRVRITSVSPQPEMRGATVTCVPEDEEFWPYVLTGAWVSTTGRTLLPRGVTVTRATVTEQLLRVGNSYGTRLTINFDVSGNFRRAEIWAGTLGNPLAKVADTTTNSAQWETVLDDVWNIEVRPFTDVSAGAAFPLTYAVVGLAEPPPNITDLSISGNVINFSTVNVVDLAGYVFRFHYGQNLDWGSAVPLHVGLVTESPYDLLTRPGGPVTIMGKAVDTSGNESRATANVFTDLGDAPVANVVETVDFGAMGYPGTLTGGTRSGGSLLATDLDSAYGTDDQSFYGDDTAPAYELSTYAQMVYTTNEVQVTDALTGSILTLDLDYSGTDLRIEYQMPGPGPAYGSDADSFYGPDDESAYGPPGPWIAWPGQLMASNDVYVFRVKIGAGPVQGRLDNLRLVLDAPDILEFIEDVPISISGTVPPYTQNFTVIKTVTATLQSGSSAAVGIDMDKTVNLAPVLRAINASKVAVSGAKADVLLKGY